MNKTDLEKNCGRIFCLENDFWQIEISSYGGQILKARHRSFAEDVIFLGGKAAAGNGRSIRGGVPVCWPWFGASPVENRPIQGFARTALWQPVSVEKEFIRLQLPLSAVPGEWVDFPFELFAEIRIGETLENTLIMKNTGNTPVDISCALHTYFRVGDCEKIHLEGLENTPFTVKGGPEEPGEKAPLQIRNEICRLYWPQTAPVVIADPVLKRKITVTKENSSSTLVWNPGSERCRQIGDLMPEEFHDFVCVECNRAGSDTLRLLPGVEDRIVQKIRIEDFS